MAESHPPPDPLVTPGRRPLPFVRTSESRRKLHTALLAGIFLLLLLHAVSVARDLILPFVLAILAALTLRPIIRALERRKIPPPLSAAVLLATMLGGFVYAVQFLATPAAAWMDRAPESLRKIERKLHVVREPMEQVSDAAERVEALADAGVSQPKAEVTVRGPSLIDVLLAQTRAFLTTAFVAFVLLYLLLAVGGAMANSVVSAVPRIPNRQRVLDIVRASERMVSRYLLTVTVINAGLGAAVATTMWLIDMPNPLLWGAVAAVLNFVPYLGAIVTATVLAGVSLLTFDDLAAALVAPALFVVLTSLEGFIVTPMLLGRSLTLSPIAIFAGMLVATWLWGVPGALLAVPLLVILRTVTSQIESLAPVSRILGG
jgi:predicted PurR-regulated permease PerM